MSNKYKRYFGLRRSCSTCPFRKQGGAELNPGRLQDIVRGLVEVDMSTFHCHKTVDYHRRGEGDATGGEWSGNERMCAGAMVYLEKLGRPTVGMRIAFRIGAYSPDALASQWNEIVDPPGVAQQRPSEGGMSSPDAASAGAPVSAVLP